MPRKQNPETRFWRKVRKTETCWLWTGALYPYGQFSVSPQVRKQAHRYAWELENGPIPDGLLACHKCDNPACVRPDHLFLGTAGENAQDMVRKGRGGWQQPGFVEKMRNATSAPRHRPTLAGLGAEFDRLHALILAANAKLFPSARPGGAPL